LAKSIVGTLLEGVRLHYFTDPGGIWLFRILSWLSFPDPADWPKLDPASRPTVVTNLNAQFNVSEIAHKPLQLSSALLIPVEQLTITSNIVSKVDATNVTILLENLDVLAIDDVRKLQEGQDWQARGWRKIATTSFTRMEAALNSGAEEIAQCFKISNELIQVTLCEDSLVTLVDLMSYIVGSKDDEALEELRKQLDKVDRPSTEEGTGTALPLTRSNLQALAAQLNEHDDELSTPTEDQSELFYSAVSMGPAEPIVSGSTSLSAASQLDPSPIATTSRRSRNVPTPEVEYLDEEALIERSWTSSPHEPSLRRVASTDSLTVSERLRLETRSPSTPTGEDASVAPPQPTSKQFGRPIMLDSSLDEVAVAAALGDALLSPTGTPTPPTSRQRTTLPDVLLGQEDYFMAAQSQQAATITVSPEGPGGVSTEMASIIDTHWDGESGSPTRTYEMEPGPNIQEETSTPPTHTMTVLPESLTNAVRFLDGDIEVMPNFFKLPADQMEKELE
jgi:hypothetical protein